MNEIPCRRFEFICQAERRRLRVYTFICKEHVQISGKKGMYKLEVERSRFMAGLKQYFPMIQERKEVLEKIRESRELLKMFHSWTEEQQEEFLDFCTGV